MLYPFYLKRLDFNFCFLRLCRENNQIAKKSAPLDGMGRFACRQVSHSCKQYQVKLIGVLLCLANVPFPLVAAQQAEKMWSVLTLSGDYGRLVYYVEPQLRLIYRDNLFQQFLTNVGLGYKVVPNWQIWFGQTFSADSQDAVAGSVDEYRLWQQISWRHRLPSMLLLSRTRFEERRSLFFFDWAYRLRQRVLFNKPLTSELSLVMSNEIFFNINKASWIITNRLDQNRAYLGVEKHLSENTYLGVGYMNQYLSTPIPQFNHVVWINWRIDFENNPL
jgi:hypothetical protein